MEHKNKGFTPLEKTHPLGIVKKRGDDLKPHPSFLTGFTVVELLTAVAIVALLIGILLPALTYVRNTAKETMQKAQLGTIELALTAFKNDYGEYPPSLFWYSSPPRNYCGAQKLVEALLGWDLLGFHPDSEWQADGWNIANSYFFYDPNSATDMGRRKGPYLELASANAFTLSQLFGSPPTPLNLDRFVLCDVFGVKKVTLANGETVNAGTPILYYRANTSSKTISDSVLSNNIYDSRDNAPLVTLVCQGRIAYEESIAYPKVFYGDPTVPILGYIQDPKVTATPWPYRPDSYILISAGVDGLYGTSDDITNF